MTTTGQRSFPRTRSTTSTVAARSRPSGWPPGENSAQWPAAVTAPVDSWVPPTPDRVVTIAVVDDQPLTRAGMERVISLDPRLSLVTSVPDVGDLLTGGIASDVVVLAVSPNLSAPSAHLVAEVAAIGMPVVVSTWEQPMSLLGAIRSGARGCLTRYSPQDAVADALRAVALGGLYICAQLVNQLHHELRRPGQDDGSGLAPREAETLRWIALGFTQAQIASRMGLSQATVNTYAKRIRGKLSVGNKAELTRVAIELGYLNDDPCHHAA